MRRYYFLLLFSIVTACSAAVKTDAENKLQPSVELPLRVPANSASPVADFNLAQTEKNIQSSYAVRSEAGLLRGLGVALQAKSKESRLLHFGDLESAMALLEIGSVSKSFTGVMSALLVIEKKLDLDLPISNYVPELKGAFVGTVTVRQLATHTARLSMALITHERMVSQNYSEAELLDFLKSYVPDPAKFPAEARQYSNVGFATLGLVISRLEHSPFTTVLAKKILRPLGMNKSGFITTEQRPAGLLQGYDVVGSAAKYSVLSDLACASGGIYSSIADMRLWLVANVHPKPSRLGRAIQLSHKFGLGWDSLPGEKPIWKNGAMPDGFASYLTLDPSLGKEHGAVILANMVNVPIVEGLAISALGGNDGSLSGTDLTAPTAIQLAKVVGTFEDKADGLSINVLAGSNGFLTIQSIHGKETATSRLIPWGSNNVFVVNDGLAMQNVIQFTQFEADRFKQLVFIIPTGHNEDGTATYKRVTFSRN